MPINPLKTFGRRKSSSNILDSTISSASPSTPIPEQDSGSTFRVLDRPRISTNVLDAQQKSRASPRRAFNSPLSHLRLGKSADDLSSFANRGSGGTTNSGSSYQYDSSSARHSSSSTLPSSVDPERDPDDEDLFPRKVKQQTMTPIVVEAPLPPPPSFAARATRAFSFGSRSSRSVSIDQTVVPAVPPLPKSARDASRQEEYNARERGLTASSYASTAMPLRNKPSSPELKLSGLSSGFGEDLDNMFSGFGKDTSRPRLAARTSSGALSRVDSEPAIPERAFSRTGQTPSPGPAHIRKYTESPYSFDAQDSDNLISRSTTNSPALDPVPPLPPQHSKSLSKTLLGARADYTPVPERASPGPATPFEESTYSLQDDTSTKLGRIQEGASYGMQTLSSASSRNGNSYGSAAPSTSQAQRSIETAEAALGLSDPIAQLAAHTTSYPPVKTNVRQHDEDSLFASPSSPASRISVNVRRPVPTPHAQKRMTNAEFDRLQRYSKQIEEPNSDDDGGAGEDDDDRDDADRAKELTQQRRRQEANMAVYRQQMKRVTGGGPADLPPPRPMYERAASSTPSNIHLGGLSAPPPATDHFQPRNVVDEDEDVPLGILQAHGFPNGQRQPVRPEENDHFVQRRTSMLSLSGGGGGGGRLPPFARKLPADPYYGAGIVNQSNRQSLALGPHSGSSVYGGAIPSPQPSPVLGHPGGLVGVIAGEERARAARRASPNPTTSVYENALPLPSNMPTGPHGMPRAMSMTNFGPLSPYGDGMMPGMGPGAPNGMPMMFGMPQLPANVPPDQLQQFMQMQMQLMQNMLAIQQQTLGQMPPLQPPNRDMLGIPNNAGHRPMSSMSSYGRPVSQALPSFEFSTPTRPATSGYASSVYGMNKAAEPGAGYAASLAPSERSNVGIPSRYRPVSMMPSDRQSRTQSMTSNATLQAFSRHSMNALDTITASPASTARPDSTIRVIDKPKGAARMSTFMSASPSHDAEEEESGWAEMAKKRSEKKWLWRRKNDEQKKNDSLKELYSGLES